MAIKLGVDVGNSDTKTQNTSTPSGYHIQSNKPRFEEEYLLYKNNYYVPTETRFPFLMDKTEDDRCIILTLFGIAKQLIYFIKSDLAARGIPANEQNIQAEISKIKKISLGAGLPIGHCDNLAKKTRDYYMFKFEGGTSFSYNGYNFNLSLERCKIFPQDIIAVFATTDSEITSKFSSYYTVGIGGYTVDICPVIKNKPDKSRCRSIDLGTTVMYNDIRQKVLGEDGLTIADNTIEAVLFGKETILSEKIKNSILGCAKKHADNIINTCKSNGFEFREAPVIFVGGGGLLLKRHLQENPLVSKCEFITDINANAVAYAKYVEMD